MEDRELLLQAVGCQTVYFDGFGGYRKINGVLRCVGYVIGSGACLNLVVSIAGAEKANRATRDALDEKPNTTGLHMWGGGAVAH